MKEILGAELDTAFQELDISAIKTYESQKTYNEYAYLEKYQVWELSEKDFERISNMNDADWKDAWGWWRYAEGSNLGSVHRRFNINNHYIYAWDGYKRDKYNDIERSYKCLTLYLCNEIGASMERNVCALAVDLARMNNIKLSELFTKYQG